MTVYKVTGSVPYQGHQPGEAFEADLEENAERRAIERGAISKSRAKPKHNEKEEEDAGDPADPQERLD